MVSARDHALKIFNLALIYIATGLGCVSHFDDENKTELDRLGGPSPYPDCGNCPAAPTNVLALERSFVAFSIIPAILLTFVVILTFLKNEWTLASKVAIIAHALGALMMLIAGAVLLSAVVKVDKYWFPSPVMNSLEEADKEAMKELRSALRGRVMYGQKLTSGVLCIFSSILCLITTVSCVFTHRKINPY